jgi:outer membrane protein OmpA-like peptidoglycan-associated protein
LAQSIREEIERLGIENVQVQEDEDGITLVMENIQFNTNSAYLIDSEREKLRNLSQILLAHPSRDLEIVGHTARAASESAAQRLSEQRALSVANFLIQEKVRPKEQIMTRGEGSRKPLVGNDTESNMAKNRRVEIKIREN